SVQYGFFIIDIKTKRLIYLNRYSQSFLKGFDYDLEELDIFQFLDQKDQKKIADAYRQINNGKITGFSGIQKVMLPRNKSIWIQYESKVVPFQGRICIQGIFKNITEIKEAADRLKESEERFRQMAENIPEVFWILERNPEKMVYVSPAYEDVFGLSIKEIYKDSRSFLKAVHPDDKEFVIKYFDDTQAPSDIEFRLLRKAGEIRWVRALTFQIPDKRGKVYRTTGIVRDITLRKRTETQLKESEARYRAVVEDQTELITRSRPDGTITFLNDAICRYFNIPKEETYNRNFLDYVHPDDRERAREVIQSVTYKNPVVTIEHRVFNKGGEVRWQRWSNRMIFDSDGKMREFLSVGRDITDQRRAEEALKESELKFRAIFENTSDGIAIFEYRLDEYGQRLIDCNDSFANMSGRSKEELLETKNIYNLQVIKDRDLDEHEIRRLIISGVAFKSTYSWKRPDGRENYIEYEAAPVILGERILVYTIDRDITERRQNEIKLRESEKKYRKLYSSLMDGYARTDLSGKILEFNSAFQEMIGYPADEIYDLAYQDITPEKWHDFEKEIINNQVMVTGYSKTYEKEYRNKSGVIFPVELRTYLTYDDYGLPDGLWAIVRDISERKETEEQLRESEEKYRSVIDNVGIGISLISPDMRILSLNNQMKKWFPKIEVDENPICFKAYNDPPRAGICSYCPTIRTLKDGEVHEDITETPSGGTIRNYKIVSSPVTDNQGNVIAAIEMVDDITDRIKAEQEIEKFKTISDRASYGTVISGLDSTITYCNEQYARMHGYTIDDLIGKKVDFLISENHKHEIEESVEELFDKGSFSAREIWHRRKDGTVFPTLVNAQILTDENNDPLYISATAIDITDKKKAEAALRNQRDMLRDVTGHVIRVQEEERRRISMELHDSIGQALSVTKLQTQNLLRKLDGDTKPIEEGLRMISQTMSDTISDLRQISANLRPVILDNLGLWPTIEWYLKDFAKKTELKLEINVERDMPAIALQSEVHVFRVIQEIMINIYKHSEADKVVFNSYAQEKSIVFEIYEDGLEFDPEEIYSPSARKRGMGLINIMERVNIVRGRLEIKSESERGGTVFVVSVPVSEPSSK
ncbi:MAG: PAS domain S-box protein, partial [candidate division Zixibacteria bacterium]|nr:PAS domain S-box protein [candidate division Zixibacteria bacterium]